MNAASSAVALAADNEHSERLCFPTYFDVCGEFAAIGCVVVSAVEQAASSEYERGYGWQAPATIGKDSTAEVRKQTEPPNAGSYVLMQFLNQHSAELRRIGLHRQSTMLPE